MAHTTDNDAGANPFTPPGASLELPARLAESDYLKAFVAYIVCAVVAGFLGGGAIGAIIGGAWGATGASTKSPAFSAIILTAAVVVALALHYVLFRFFVNRMIVRKILART